MAKIRHKITKHTTQEVTLDQNNAFKAQKHGNSETFQLRFNDKTDYPLNEIYSINKKIQSQKAIICKNISNPSSSESCLEVSTNFTDDFYFEFEINTKTADWFTNSDIQYNLGNFELEVHYTQGGTTQFINLYYNENAVPGPLSDTWLTGEFGPELSNEDLQNGVKFFTDQLSSSVSHVILKIKGAGAVSLTKITAKKYSDNVVLKNYINPYKEMSGITSNSVRKVGRNINNKTSLPNYYKETLTGIANRNITYFDTESFVFSDNSNINIVEQIPSDSKFDGYINNIVSAPNTSPGFQSQGSFKSYHLDSVIDRKLELSSIKPYNDEYSYAFQDSDFFASSSNPYNTLDNFSGLGDLIAIEINLDSENGAVLSRTPSSVSYPYRDQKFIEKYSEELSYQEGVAPAGNTEWWNLQNRPMAYFDFTNRRWEYITSGSNTLTTPYTEINDQIVGFSPGSKYLTYYENYKEDKDDVYQDFLVGNPTKNFGFPVDTRFAGFNKNLFKLNTILEKSFALEKISYEFSFSSRGYNKTFLSNEEGGFYEYSFPQTSKQQNITFFVLNQYEAKSKFSDNTITLQSPNNSTTDLTFNIDKSLKNNIVHRNYSTGLPYKDSSFTVGESSCPEQIFHISGSLEKSTFREIVSFNNLFIHSVDNRLQSQNSNFFRKNKEFTSLNNVKNQSSLQIDAGQEYFQNISDFNSEDFIGWTDYYGSYEIDSYGMKSSIRSSINVHKKKVKLRDFVRTPLTMDSHAIIEKDNANPEELYFADNSEGDKDLSGTMSIRSADIKSGASVTKKVTLNSNIHQNSRNDISLNSYKQNYKNQPYILKPEDNLIFGVDLNKLDHDAYNEIDVGERQLFYIHPGEFKVILYGRYLQNNKLVNDNHSSQLNSKSINSSIIGDTFPQDQFIEPINIKENTYVDRIYTGDITLENTREKTGLLSSNTLGIYTGCISLNTKNIYYDSMVPNINDILNSDDNFYTTTPSLLTSREMLFSKINDIEFPQTLNYFSKNLSIKNAEGLSHSVYFGPIEDNFSSFMPAGIGVNSNNSNIFNEDESIDVYSFEDTKLVVSNQMSFGIVDIDSHVGDIDFDIHKHPVGTYKAVVFSGGDDYHLNANNLKYPGDVVAPDPQKLQQRNIKIASITTPDFKNNTKLTLNIVFKTLNAGIMVSTTDKSAEVISELSGLQGFDYDVLNPASFEGRNHFNISLVGKSSGRVYNKFLCSLATNTGYYVDNILTGATWKTNYGSVEFLDLPEEEYDMYLYQPHKGGASKDCFALSDLKITASVSYDIAKFPIQEYLPFDLTYQNLTREIFNETVSNIEHYQNKRPQTLVSHYNDDLSEVVFDDIFVRKYGLLNVKPKESKVYFRDNHYGFYSDLIYTTPYGKQYNKESNLINDYLVKINKYNNDFTLADISDNYRYGRSFKPFAE